MNPSSSVGWARHLGKAKQAINHTNDPSFEREYLKSELHCKHIKQHDGVSHTQDTVIFPLGRPLTVFSGKMINSPVHYFGLGVGYIIPHYDPSMGIFEIFYQTFSHSCRHLDVKFPGPYPDGLWVAHVAKGSSYVVDPDHDGRTDRYIQSDPPNQIPIIKHGPDTADFTLWARPIEEVYSPLYVDGALAKFWESININSRYLFRENLSHTVDSLLKGLSVVYHVLPGCAPITMEDTCLI